MKIVHHFSGREYAKETFIPAGMLLAQHEHKFDHLSILAQGKAAVFIDQKRTDFEAPCCLTIKANTHHAVLALTDVVWYCVHATEETEELGIDETLIVDGSDCQKYLECLTK